MYAFNLEFLKRFLRILKLMFPAWKSSSVILCFFLLLLSLLEQVIIYNIGLIPSKYYKVLGTKDKEGFQNHTIISVLLILAEAFIKSSILYVAGVLYITWRGNLSSALHEVYFKDTVYYQINNIDTTIDNVDQRIAQDVDKLCDQFSLVFIPLVISPFTIGYYLYQTAVGTGYLGPVSVFVFFIVATVINKFIMSPVVKYVYYQEQKEGDFRFKHMQMRVNSESAAFYQCGQIEKTKTNTKLHTLLAVQHKLIRWEYLLNFSIKTADYLGSILSYIALAFPIFLGVYDQLTPSDLAALISKYAFVTIYLISCFTRLIDLAANFTDIAGTAHRVGQLLEVLQRLAEKEDKYNGRVKTVGDTHTQDEITLVATGVVSPGEEELTETTEMSKSTMAFRVNNLTYGQPKSSDILCKNLNFQLESGQNILVTGESGCGKSSLLRVINNLWRTVSGFTDHFVPTDPKHILYLPQKPYFTNGTLREQIMFPITDEECVPDDNKMYEYLERTGLSGLVDRIGDLDSTVDWYWYNELSPGEMQRLSFVRLFFHQPSFAILDEATSQVDQERETSLFNICAELGITLLSVGHRDSIRKHHDVELKLDGRGGWSLQPITEDVIGS